MADRAPAAALAGEDLKAATPPTVSSQDLQRIVEEADLGGRKPVGLAARLIFAVAVTWSLFQLWFASPLPFIFNIGILNDTQARAIHLAFAFFLVFLCYPTFAKSSRRHIPYVDWALALVGAFCAAYLVIFYRELATRPGQPTLADLVTAAVGMLILLEATRRTQGGGMVWISLAFILYSFAGRYMPDVIQHGGVSYSKFLQHMWLTTEGVFGVALGVSTNFVFLFVLFGALLDKAGGNNWMMQISVALLGHLRGGPAKVAVVSSAANGIVSGSSVSNVVSGGIFTIPLMKRAGLSGVKAAAIETASSVNGQIMPPVMGAASFLMAEYVGIPHAQVVKHAFIPALISYVALLYIVHLEALMIDAKPFERAVRRGQRERWIRRGLGWSGTILACCLIYYGINAIKAVFGDAAANVLLAAGLTTYLASLWYAARHPDLELDDPSSPVLRIPEAWTVARTGLHFLIPIVVLLWCLMFEGMSPSLSVFWAVTATVGILLTQRPLMTLFRGGREITAALRQSAWDLVDGLNLGARNMMGIAVATATAGIVVGTMTLTGMSQRMTDLVEAISGGNVMLMLLLTAAICLIIGLGIPTTASYILVASLMAPVIVELGAQAGVAIPLIAVHLFVFYFGIMADVTPPVGLAAFAAAAISGEDPNKIGWQGTVYSMRTAILPFVFIFNPAMLLIGVDSWSHTVLVVVAATAAILLFAAASMGWFVTKSRLWESAILLVACFALFRPDWWIDRFYPASIEVPADQLLAEVAKAPAEGRLTLIVEGQNIEGEDVRKTVSLPLGDDKLEPQQRLRAAGLSVSGGAAPTITNVTFGSAAKRIGLEAGFRVSAIVQPAPGRPSVAWPYTFALALVGGVWWSQRRRSPRPHASAIGGAAPLPSPVSD
jgi:TRAP transporter 4TM/12TM fusion protein